MYIDNIGLMKACFCLLFLSIINISCNTDNPIRNEDILKPRSKSISTHNLLEPEANQQIEGHVYFDDGTLLESWDPIYYIRVYHSSDTTTEIEGSEDEIDSNGGHYGCAGVNILWPTGQYFLKTDFVIKNSVLYIGRRWVNHTYNISTHSDIFLYPLTFSQVDGVVSYDNGSKPTGNPYINIYQYGDLKMRTIINTDGTYSYTDIPENWVTGYYTVQTDLIYKKGIAYQGDLTVYHEQFVRTKLQNIVLFRIDSRP